MIFISGVTRKSLYLTVLSILSVSFFVGIPSASASVLSPGPISTCGELAAPGTYSMTTNIGGGGSCILITSDAVVLDGGGHTLTGTIVGDAVNLASPGYNFTVQNITVTATTSANGSTCIGSSGGAAGSGGSITASNATLNKVQSNGAINGNGNECQSAYNGSGGTLSFSNSTFTSLQADGASGSGAGGNGGTVSISKTSLDLSNTPMSLSGGVGGFANGSDGTLTLTYSTLSSSNTVFPYLSDLVLNGPGNAPGDLGSFGGGVYNAIFPGSTISNISQCNLGFAGTYTLSANLTGNCTIRNNDIILDGAAHTLTGNITGTGSSTPLHSSGSSYTIQNITVTGTTSANGVVGYNGASYVNSGNGGSVTAIESTSTAIQVNGASIGSGANGGNGGAIVITKANLDLTGANLFVSGGTGDQNGTPGILTLNYTNLTYASYSFPVLSDLVLNNPDNIPGDLGPFAGGLLTTALPGSTISNISQCNLAYTGTYTLGANLVGNCTITADKVVLEGAGHTLTGRVIADSLSVGLGRGHYITLQNVTVTGTTSSDGIVWDGSPLTNYNIPIINIINSTVATTTANADTGGSILVSNSTSTSLQANGSAGDGGTVTITASSSLSLTHSNISVVGDVGGGHTHGTFIVNYGGTFSYTNLVLSAVSNVIFNGSGNIPGSLGSFAGGVYPQLLYPGTISACGITASSGTYNLGSNIGSGGTCLTVATDGVIIDGDNGSGGRRTLTGNINGDGGASVAGHSFTLRNIIVTGSTTANGGDIVSSPSAGGAGGSITIASSTIATTTANGGTSTGAQSVGGSITITNATVSAAYANGGSGSITMTTGGSITVSSSTILSRLEARGSPCVSSCTGGDGGSISVSSSTVPIVSADGGSPTVSGDQGIAGSITLTNTATLILNNMNISATGKTYGRLTLNYSTLSHASTTISALSHLILNGPGNLPGDIGSFAGGVIGLVPGDTITTIGQAVFSYAGTYYVGSNLVGNITIPLNNITLNGQGHSITGSISGDGTNPSDAGYNFTLQNMTVTGTTSARGSDSLNADANGGHGGSIIISSSTVSDIAVSGGSTFGSILNTAGGAGGSISVQNSTAGNLFATGANTDRTAGGSGGTVSVSTSTVGSVNIYGGDAFFGGGVGGTATVLNAVSGAIYAHGGLGSNATGGNGGTIFVDPSVTGSLDASGGDAGATGGNGGTITVINSIANPIGSTVSANGGSIVASSVTCRRAGNGGTVTLTGSTYGIVTTNPGANSFGTCSSGSSGSGGIQHIIGVYTPPVPSIGINPGAPTISPHSLSSVTSSGFQAIIPSFISSSTQSINSGPRTIAEIVRDTVVRVGDTITSSPASKVVQATGFFAGLLATVGLYTETAFATPLAASETLLIPVRLWGLLLASLGIRKRARPWGTVYDSVTKQPIDPAFVTARDASGAVVAESITDIDGRYGFLLPDGVYYVAVEKTNYDFPSKKMAGKSSDELYTDLYFGGPVTITGGEVLDKNIPMDQKNFDWNEYAKKERSELTFHSKNEKPWAVIGHYTYAIGLVISVATAIFHPSTYNIVILVIYIIILISLRYGIKRKKLGNIIDKETHEPLSYAIIRVTGAYHQVLLRSSACDARGRYYCIVPKGQCYVDIEKKNEDGTYVKVYSSSLISTTSGIINSDFQV